MIKPSEVYILRNNIFDEESLPLYDSE